jgi:hypothetical protein
VEQGSREIRIQRKMVFRVLGFHLVYHSVDHSPRHSQGKVVEVDVLPLQGKYFTHP